MPQSLHHVSIIMDGNGRWAAKRKKSRLYGHKHGLDVAREIVRSAAEASIPEMTLFGFSRENRHRPGREVDSLTSLFFDSLSDVTDLVSNGIRLKFIGDLSFFNRRLNQRISRAENKTREGAAMRLNIALNYSGRWDIAQSVAKLPAEARRWPSERLQEAIGDHLMVKDTDLIIRTGDETRISNFLLWQSSYAEIYFTKTLWPDFGAEAFQSILKWFDTRQRRFGRTQAQVRGSV